MSRPDPSPDESLAGRYGIGAVEEFARLSELSDVGGHAGVTRYLFQLYSRRHDLQQAYPGLDGDGAWRFVDWVYRHGVDEVPIPPELLATGWLAEPSERGGDQGLNRYLELLRRRRPDLVSAFREVPGADTAAYVEWARSVAQPHDPALRAVLGDPPSDRPAWVARAGGERLAGAEPGVNVVGYLGAVLGIGEAARRTVAALRAAGVPLRSMQRRPESDRGGLRRSGGDAGTAGGHDVNLVCLNPDQHWRLMRDSAGSLSPDRYTIGFWWWEIADALPLEWRFGFRLVDEVWVGSEHAARAIRRVAPVPVVNVALAVAPEAVAQRTRAELGLPEGFVFLTLFDYDSTIARKNPIGAIDAFTRAFAPGSGTALVLKSINAGRRPQERALVEAAAAAHPDIHLVDGHLDAADKNALLAACDCYVSLHRAEGFGLPLAEAMYLGRPAIATRYSGNLEFMTDDNSYLVDHGMARVGPVAEPYYPAEGHWAEPSLDHAAELMRAVVDDRPGAERRGARAADDMRRNFSPAVVGRTMAERIEAVSPRRRERPSGDLRSAGLWVPSLEGVRGLASLSVALTHITLAIGWYPQHEPMRGLRFSAFFSIEFLFLISAFVAFLPVAATGRFVGARTYGIRRAGRVLPLYLTTILLAVVLGGLLRPVTGTDFPHDAGAVLVHFAFLQNMVYPYESGFGVQGVIWMMSIGVLFYISFPGLARPWLRHPFLWLGGAVLAALVWRETTAARPDLYLQYPLFFTDFALGMTGAFVYARMRRGELPRLSRHAPAICAASLLALIVLLYAAGVPVSQGGPPWGEAAWLSVAVPLAFVCFLVALPYAPAWFQWPAGNRVVRWLGDVSYGLFLCHFLVIWLVLRFVHIPRNGTLSSTLELLALVLPITLLAAYSGTRWIEGPLRIRAQRLAARLDRRSGTRPAGSAQSPAAATAD